MNNMKRMIWIAVALLVMIAIMGFGLHTLNRITEVNKERREKDKGEAFVAKILETTVATNVWDKLRAKQDANATAPLDENVIQTDENGNEIIVSTENAMIPDMGDGNIVVQTGIFPANQNSPIEVVPSPQEEFATVAIPIEP